MVYVQFIERDLNDEGYEFEDMDFQSAKEELETGEYEEMAVILSENRNIIASWHPMHEEWIYVH